MLSQPPISLSQIWMFGQPVSFPSILDHIGTVYNHVTSILNPPTNEKYVNGDDAFLVGEVMNRDHSALIVPVYEYTKACGSFDTCVEEFHFMN